MFTSELSISFIKGLSATFFMDKHKSCSHSGLRLFFKAALILSFVFCFFSFQGSKTNSISLLAVSENEAGEIVGGSLVDLSLKVVPGSGKIYIGKDTLEEIDTQISVINSQKIACQIFDLNCNKYDFYYDFSGSALVLKGPSASSAIAILVAKTLRGQTVDKGVVITGSLNSGGLIGVVGGIEEKIAIADEKGFKRILIPIFSAYNASSNDIEVQEVIDIVDAYNFFGPDTYELPQKSISYDSYSTLMKTLADDLCARSVYFEQVLDPMEIKDSLNASLAQARQNYNSSLSAYELGNFYSSASFCYTANLNYRSILDEENTSLKEGIDEQLRELDKNLFLRERELLSSSYLNSVQTLNDFYVYLIISDRLDEAQAYIEEAQSLNSSLSITVALPFDNETSSTNSTVSENQTQNISVSKEKNLEEDITSRKTLLYSYALERYYTIELWEKLLVHSGEKLHFTDETLDTACMKISRELTMKEEVLKEYGITFFDKEISEQSALSRNPTKEYVCLYKGLELSARINTVLNSVGVDNETLSAYANRVFEFTQTRLSQRESGAFPLIPVIYSEYAGDLISQEQYGTGILYANFALTFADLDLYLNSQSEEEETFLREFLGNLFAEPLFMLGFLLLLAFT